MEGKKPYKTYKKATAKTEKAPAYKPKRGKMAPLMKEEALMVHGSRLMILLCERIFSL